jgi:hypothetical protein
MSDAAVTPDALQGPIDLPAPQLVLRAVCDGRRLGMQLTYVEGIGSALKAEGGAWFGPRRMWVRQATSVEDTVQWLERVHQGHWFDYEGARVPLQSAFAAVEHDYFVQRLDLQVFPLEGGGLAVSSLYDEFVVRCLRSLRGRFHKFANAWEIQRCPLDQLLRVLHETAGIATEYVYVHETPIVLEAMHAPPSSPVPISVPALAPDFEPKEGDGDAEVNGNGFLSVIGDEMSRVAVDEEALARIAAEAGLRDYQVVGSRFMASRTGALNGDDMGLGKSRQTVVACWLAAAGGRILIACPATLRINWEREIQAVFPGAAVGMAGDDRPAALRGCQWVIASYERLGSLVREPDLDFAVMACDEAHMLKEHQAGRTRNAFLMATRIARRYAVTGTPLLNREVELHTLLRLTGHRLGQLPLKDFRQGYAGSPEKRAALAAALKGWMIRRRKNVLKDLGAKHRHLRWISPAEGLAGYEETLRDMNLAVMPKITRLRQRLEALKLDFILETAEGLPEDEKIIVFCEYMETVATLKHLFSASGIRCVSLVGSDPTSKRQKAVDEFQNDPGVRAFITTTAAGGVGITLTRATLVAFCSLPWTPALMRQAEDRAYRLGQTRDVNVLVPLVAGTIDEQVWRLLEAKMAIEQDVVEGADVEETALGQAADPAVVKAVVDNVLSALKQPPMEVEA